MREEYNIVFECTGEEGTIKGIRTWITYGSKRDFDKSYVPGKSERIIAEGVSEEKAVKLCNNVPLEVMLKEPVKPSSYRTGRVDRDLLRMNVTDSLFGVASNIDHTSDD